MKKFKAQSSSPPKASNDSTVNQTISLPHPLQDLTGVRLRTMPIPKHVYDYVMKRDARIFERLADV